MIVGSEISGGSIVHDILGCLLGVRIEASEACSGAPG